MVIVRIQSCSAEETEKNEARVAAEAAARTAWMTANAIDKPCRHFATCGNRDCHYQHPPDCRFGDDDGGCRRADCRFRHYVRPCNNFVDCGSPTCRFRHAAPMCKFECVRWHLITANEDGPRRLRKHECEKRDSGRCPYRHRDDKSAVYGAKAISAMNRAERLHRPVRYEDTAEYRAALVEEDESNSYPSASTTCDVCGHHFSSGHHMLEGGGCTFDSLPAQ